MIIKFLTVGEPGDDGRCSVFFEVNGQPREVTTANRKLASAASSHRLADPANDNHIAATMPGMVVSLAVGVGDKVEKGQALMVLEAMKMESTLYAEKAGKIAEMLVAAGRQIENGELLAVLE